jgi:putative tryptophan/tyrosine transport system substrate-binding protein
MKRRQFIGLVGGAAIAWPLNARAQQTPKTRRIAFVHSGLPVAELTETSRTMWIRTFLAELRRLGVIEGSNIVIERFSGGGKTALYAALAGDVVNARPDIIIANSSPLVKAFQSATTTIPIVAIMSDPIASGLASSLAQPGANLTGVSVDAGPGIAAKRLQILKEAVPAAARIALLVDTHVEVQRSNVPVLAKLLAAVDEPHLRRAFADMAEEKVDAVLMSTGGSFIAQRALIVELAARHRLPVIYPFREHVEAGGLMSYGPDLGELAKRLALTVQQVLGGAKPGDIPIHQPVKFEMVLNMKTAKALGLAVPTIVLAQADEVIE